MASDVKPPTRRRYDRSGRQLAAAATRQRIQEAAHQLFCAQGYVGTRMAEIAKSAGVSVETLYATFGPKATLVRHLVEVAISGADPPLPPLERPWVQEVAAEPDPRRKIELFAAGVRQMQERVAPLWAVVKAAAADDPALHAMVEELTQRRVGHMGLFVEYLAAAGGLRANLSPTEATDVIWAMTAPEFFGLLVLERGWSPAAFETWVADTWRQLLLPEPSGPTCPA